jgi:hypothetical protein
MSTKRAFLWGTALLAAVGSVGFALTQHPAFADQLPVQAPAPAYNPPNTAMPAMTAGQPAPRNTKLSALVPPAMRNP